jgi:drug/metabolite transporter (DMT)-like permease
VRRPLLLMATFAATWALIEAVAAGVLVRYSPFQVVFTRYGVHLLFLFVLFRRTPRVLVRTTRPAFQVARSLLMLGMPACYVFSVQSGVPQSTLMMIFWLSPLLVMGLSAAFLREATRPADVGVALLAAFGTLLMTGRGPLTPASLAIFPLGMALTFSAYVVMTRGLRTEPTSANLFYTALGPFLALAPFMLSLWVTPTWRDALVMVSIGVVGLFALYALDRATATAPLSRSAPFLYLELPLAMLLEWGLGRFQPGHRTLVGIVTVPCCLALLLLTARPPLRAR